MIYTFIVLFCSFMYGASAVLCKQGLQHHVELRNYSLKRILIFVLQNKLWIAGIILSAIANVTILQVQSHIDVSVVYPILNFSYVFIWILGFMFLNERFVDYQWMGAVLIILGTLLLVFVENPVTGGETNFRRLFILNGLSILVIATLIYTAYRIKIQRYELLYAVCTGVSFGNVETYIKVNTNLVTVRFGEFSIFSIDSLIQFVSMWPFLMWGVFVAIGWVCLQITYSNGSISATVPLFATLQNAITLSSGYFIFGEFLSGQKIFGIGFIFVGVWLLVSSNASKNEVVRSEKLQL